ncbi:hypothetical protein [Cohnella silvisoli]|uniref:DUF4309 domain-containing protein n=1 Tax=Cohnella silvisoli TaxID=2873699 RepID=A0ABV1KPC7_9BACL|nr:hypothetical protein [Cohnella silvisoli]MCD9025601.1 hypothetical protein [Cohnella silvisoli]
MPGKAYFRLKIWSSLLLVASLVSCRSPVNQPAFEPANDPSIISSKLVLSAQSPDDINTGGTYSSEPSVAPVSASSSAAPKTDKTPASTVPVAEVSPIQPSPTEIVLPPENSFQRNSPSLGGIKLGASDKAVYKQYGLPKETYSLPGDNQTIEIWEYAGVSVGLNASNQVVYVEITSSDVNTGIQGLVSGMKGSEAAHLLGVENDDQTNVLSVEVTGGWFKIDLDPDTQQVLSLKLLGKEI